MSELNANLTVEQQKIVAIAYNEQAKIMRKAANDNMRTLPKAVESVFETYETFDTLDFLTGKTTQSKSNETQLRTIFGMPVSNSTERKARNQKMRHFVKQFMTVTQSSKVFFSAAAIVMLCNKALNESDKAREKRLNG